ncbi:MAG: pseudouridine synthase [Pseudomonadota bacterium]
MNQGQDQGQGERVSKHIARSGLCSRREADRWIEKGRVQIDGKTVIALGTRVKSALQITVDGKSLPQQSAPRLWRFYKPVGLVTTHKDPEGRPTVFSALAKKLPRVVSVGRLDMYSEGLLLLTNDGMLARTLELPKSKIKRHYRVCVEGHVDVEKLSALKKGIDIEGVRYEGIHIGLEKQKKNTCWLHIILQEGKNREIRRIMTFFGYTILKLIRTKYGPFDLGNLKPGEVEEVPSAVLDDYISRDLRK